MVNMQRKEEPSFTVMKIKYRSYRLSKNFKDIVATYKHGHEKAIRALQWEVNERWDEGNRNVRMAIRHAGLLKYVDLEKYLEKFTTGLDW